MLVAVLALAVLPGVAHAHSYWPARIAHARSYGPTRAYTPRVAWQGRIWRRGPTRAYAPRAWAYQSSRVSGALRGYSAGAGRYGAARVFAHPRYASYGWSGRRSWSVRRYVRVRTYASYGARYGARRASPGAFMDAGYRGYEPGYRGYQTASSGFGGYSRGADVVSEARRWLGSGNMTGLRGPWCAEFASFVLRRTGHAPLPNAMAGSALSYGRRLPGPQVGALAVIGGRRGAGHVGFVSGINPDGSIQLLSGNWGRRVSNASISRRSVLAYVEVR